MLKVLINVFRVTELRNKVLFTLAMLAVYRVGFWIPLPGVDQTELSKFFARQASEGSTFSKIAGFVELFSGGAFSQSTIFGLGIMPYISAGIIFQLAVSASPRMKKLQEEGPTGRQKIQEWTRYATLALCLVQGFFWLSYINKMNMVMPEVRNNPLWWVMAVTTLTAGTMFLMWLGEQIDRFGIGNGVSMIIMAGILTRMPGAINLLQTNFEPGVPGKMGWPGMIAIIVGFVGITAAAVLVTVAQRRITVQQAKHTRGRRVFGGQRSYLPLRINHGGVMPIVFASSLMIFPTVILSGLADALKTSAGSTYVVMKWFSDQFSSGAFLHEILYIGMIYLFSYFWITVQFNPEEMSKQLRDHGSFVPGLRPGPRTRDYLETVVTRITFVGATFLALIAVIPTVINSALNVPMAVTQFLGGTGLLITVSVTLDFLQRVEANLLMRNYEGFLTGGAADLRGPRATGSLG